MATSGDNSYLITGKLCPPKLPMHNLTSDGWNSLTPSLLESVFTETTEQGKQTSSLNPLSALSFQASVWLSTDDGLSASSVVCLPYFFCNFCDHHTDSKAQLLRHIACRHVFKCKLCDFISITRYDLVQHQLHKHLDAKEMQPILGSKIVHMNLSILQRNLPYLPPCDNGCNNLSSSNSVQDTSELVNSSQMNISKVYSDGHKGVNSQQLNNQSDHLPLTVEEERPVVSSKCKLPQPGVNTLENSDLLKAQTWHTNSFSKRRCSKEEFSDCELSPKRSRHGCKDNQTKFQDAFTPSNSHSFQMPHFLDESDSNVTSSCSPYKNTSPLLFENSGTEQISPIKKQIKPHDTNPRVLSFLMEPISSSATVERKQPNTTHDDSSTSSTGTIQKILHWSNEQSGSIAFKEALPTSPFVSQAVIGYSKDDSPAFFKASEEDTSGENHHPGLSFLERLHRQQEQANGSGDLFLESCSELLETSHDGSHILHTGGSIPAEKYEILRRSYSTSSENAQVDNICGRRQSDHQCVNTRSIDNFLVTRADTLEVRRRVENAQFTLRENDSKNDFKQSSVGNVETNSSVGEGIKYDLLRKLLIGASGIQEHTATLTASPEIDGKQPDASVSKELPSSNFHHTSYERSESRSHTSLLTRASDMSLKDLLTQGLENIPASSVFYSCCYCNLKSSSKAELQRHVEICKCRGSERTKAQNNVYGLSGHIISKPNTVYDALKTKASTSVDAQVDSLYSSEKCMASEVLKSLSEHYSESLSSDISSQDKSHTPERETQVSEACLLKDQTVSTGTTSHTSLDVNSKHLRDRPARKKPEVDYSYESSNSSSSYTSDSDYKPNSVSNVRKKTKRKQSTNPNLSPSKRCGSSRTAATQCLDQDYLPQKKPEIHYTCLYCSFSASDRANMQQHVIESHTECAPFAEAFTHPKGKSMMYFCRGMQSKCSFCSSEAAEIFEHIKLCYCGCLDSFDYCDNTSLPDYSQVLYSLGEASKFIDHSAVMFYCLRCQYYAADFQQVSDHVSNNHAYYVAGVLFVDNVLKETSVGMVCIVCKCHVSVEQWAVHSCRMHYKIKFCIDAQDGNSDAPPGSKLEAQLRLSGAPSCKTSDEDIQDSCKFDSASKAIDHCFEEEDCKPDVRLGHSSADYIQNHALSRITVTQMSSKMVDNNNFSEAVNVKQEIPDMYFVKEEFADVPVHFSEFEQAQADPVENCKSLGKDNHSGYDIVDPQASLINSPHTCSRKISTGSSVLQSLLTAPKDVELKSKSFGMLHNLLKADHSVKEKGQSKPLTVLPAEMTPGSANTQLHYPCILEMLSRQDSSVQETYFADSISPSPKPTRLQMGKCFDHSTSQPISVLTSASCSPLISPQQTQNAASTKCLPNLSISMTSQPSSVSAFELSPPLIPQLPQLPMIPPLSPSPPLTPAKSLPADGSQDVPGPFANLLRLLSKTKFHSGSS